MIIAFYHQDNKKGYNRHTFDTLTPQTIIEKLKELSPLETRFYDPTSYDYHADTPNLADLAVDFNSGELASNDWDCVIINANIDDVFKE